MYESSASLTICTHDVSIQVLCAANAAHDQVDPVAVPMGVPNGERIKFEGCVDTRLDMSIMAESKQSSFRPKASK